MMERSSAKMFEAALGIETSASPELQQSYARHVHNIIRRMSKEKKRFDDTRGFHPMEPQQSINKIAIDRRYASTSDPVRARFELDGRVVNPLVLSKTGSDLHVDAFIMQVFDLLNRLFQHSDVGVAAECPTYRVAAVGDNGGLLEFIQGTEPFSFEVASRSWNTLETIPSILGSLLCGYITTLADRNEGNTLFKEGKVINIDFDQSIGNPKSGPFEVIRSISHEVGYNEFRNTYRHRAEQVWKAVYEYAGEIVTAFDIMDPSSDANVRAMRRHLFEVALCHNGNLHLISFDDCFDQFWNTVSARYMSPEAFFSVADGMLYHNHQVLKHYVTEVDTLTSEEVLGLEGIAGIIVGYAIEGSTAEAVQLLALASLDLGSLNHIPLMVQMHADSFGVLIHWLSDWIDTEMDLYKAPDSIAALVDMSKGSIVEAKVQLPLRHDMFNQEYTLKAKSHSSDRVLCFAEGENLMFILSDVHSRMPSAVLLPALVNLLHRVWTKPYQHPVPTLIAAPVLPLNQGWIVMEQMKPEQALSTLERGELQRLATERGPFRTALLGLIMCSFILDLQSVTLETVYFDGTAFHLDSSAITLGKSSSFEPPALLSAMLESRERMLELYRDPILLEYLSTTLFRLNEVSFALDLLWDTMHQEKDVWSTRLNLLFSIDKDIESSYAVSHLEGLAISSVDNLFPQ